MPRVRHFDLFWCITQDTTKNGAPGGGGLATGYMVPDAQEQREQSKTCTIAWDRRHKPHPHTAWHRIHSNTGGHTNTTYTVEYTKTQ